MYFINVLFFNISFKQFISTLSGSFIHCLEIFQKIFSTISFGSVAQWHRSEFMFFDSTIHGKHEF